ncbi:MAG: bifunctional methylenetetrahydrofolate dehydrogenase/methenyltetrahydrofolate cyclohydrolase FolD [Clostridia bacterium]|nr:bifunctional methylenetetrahydrofolate dehydrogenase/methenyltetrahydrofolate cyclohydrolase FolD [Clostridia bacterium]
MIIDGKQTAAQVRAEVKQGVEQAVAQYGTPISLAVLVVGENPASAVYVRNKIKACAEVGIRSIEVRLPESATDEDILVEIERCNADDSIHGILLQLPLPPHCHEQDLLAAIDPDKDVDGLHIVQRGRLFCGLPALLPCTPYGVMTLLSAYGIDPKGKHAVVVGRSNLVGKPLAMMLLNANATVTVCHSRTVDLPAVCRTADILCVAVGRAGFITEDMVKPGAVVIDVGINRVDGKLCGDVDYDAVCAKCSFITPVPGGVGPMTVAMLMKNTLTAYLNRHQ